jgi:hypothetical protein
MEQDYKIWRWGKGLQPCRPTEKSLRTNLGKLGRGRLTSLAIRDCLSFDMSEKRLGLVFSFCTKLQHLRLDTGSPLAAPLKLPKDVRAGNLPRLKTLRLGITTLDMAFTQALLESSANDLEELSMLSFPHGYQDLQWPLLPKLKDLALQSRWFAHIIDMDCIMRQTPNVTKVWLDKIAMVEHPTRAAPSSPRWEKLEDVFMSENVEILSPTMMPQLSSGLRELDIDGEHYSTMCGHVRPLRTYRTHGCNPRYDWMGAAVASAKYADAFLTDTDLVHLPNLRMLALRKTLAIDPKALEPLTLASMRSNSLRALALEPMPNEFINFVQSRDNAGHEPLVCDSLLALSLSGADPASGSPVKNPDDFLMALLSMFPNLKVLDIGKEPFSPATIAKVVKHGVKYVYHWQGFRYSEVTRWAEAEGLAEIEEGATPDPVMYFLADKFGEAM